MGGGWSQFIRSKVQQDGSIIKVRWHEEYNSYIACSVYDLFLFITMKLYESKTKVWWHLNQI